MPRVIETTVYKFEELPEETQAKVLDKYRGWNTDHFEWWEWTYDMWKDRLKTYGFTDVKIWFSGFWSQGDGACFDADVDLDCLTNYMFYQSTSYEEARDWRALNIACFNGLVDDPRIVIIDHRYNHENCRTLEYDSNFQDNKTSEQLVELLGTLEELRYDLCMQIYKDLKKEYEYLTADEQVRESLEINECEFTAAGIMI